MSIEEALKILEIPPFITKDEIKKRYKELASLYHPDIVNDSGKMVEINSAYETLIEYIDNFRYSFDDSEISKQLPYHSHNEKFKF